MNREISPFWEVLVRDLCTKTPATTQSALFPDAKCTPTRLTGTGFLPTILSRMVCDDNNGFIMRSPNTGSAAGSKPNVGFLGPTFLFDLVFSIVSFRSIIFGLIDLKKSLKVGPATLSGFSADLPPTALSSVTTAKRTGQISTESVARGRNQCQNDVTVFVRLPRCLRIVLDFRVEEHGERFQIFVVAVHRASKFVDGENAEISKARRFRHRIDDGRPSGTIQTYASVWRFWRQNT